MNFEFYKKQGDLFSKIFLALNRLEVSGQKNEIEKGPNIIVANHKGVAKDIVLIYKIFERQIFFVQRIIFFPPKILEKKLRMDT
ncbi:MAG: hypothetical protein KAT17_09110 [Candidatus Aminicenantes bacterium]|nr:hypothetical protein [Candidatus Aminicenantes bacterium]